MRSLNWPRVILGGLLAGVTINTIEFVLNSTLLKEAWIEVLERPEDGAIMSGSEVAGFNVWGFAIGWLAIWLYASIRDRYGSGARTAVQAALAVWLLSMLLVGLQPGAGTGLGGVSAATWLVAGWLGITLGTLLGAWQYRPRPHGSADGPSS
ncbi:MAG: hypothetical protein O7A98_08485 [Acidobacteria bacterium]|nr:hypothetical protein [Acidobacteriota bacterium]